MKITYDAACDIGCMRTNNEDMLLVDRRFLRDETAAGQAEINPNSRFCAIVADGMGGCEGGELASDIACQEFDTWVNDLPSGLPRTALQQEVQTFAQTAHRLINRRGEELEGYRGMGTTLAGLFFYEATPFWLNIGDSRIYIFRDGLLRQLSRDHSLRNLFNDPSQPSNLIYNSLGTGSDADTFADCNDLPLFDGDCLLICSDGLTDLVDDGHLSLLLQRQSPAQAFVASARAAGGNDNISVVLLHVSER